MTAPRLVGMPSWQFLDNQGAVLAGGTLTFNSPGTSTNKTIYQSTDSTGSTHTNPHTLDAAGRPTAPIFGAGLYDVVVKDSSGSTITTISNWGDNDSAVATDLQNLIQNGSAETDDDADNVPDQWTVDDTVNDDATIVRDTTDSNHGTASFKITSGGTAGATFTSAFFEASPQTEYAAWFDTYASASTIDGKVQVEWFDGNQASLSTSTIYDPDSGNYPTSWTRENVSVDSPASALYGRLILNHNSTSGTLHWDNVVVTQAEESIVAPGTVFGMRLTRDSGDTDHDINITAGKVRAHTDDYNIIHSSEMTKRMDAAWAKGDDAGGMESGTSISADSMYAVWAIAASAKGEVDYLGSASFTSPTMPSGYDKKNLIGVFWTDGSSNVYDFVHYHNHFRLLGDIIEDVDDTTITSVTYETATLRCPPNCIAQIYTYAENTGTLDDDMIVWLRPKGANDNADSSNAEESYLGIDNDTATINHISVAGDIYVNDDSQMEYATQEAAGAMTVKIAVRGCRMLTRGNPNV